MMEEQQKLNPNAQQVIVPVTREKIDGIIGATVRKWADELTTKIDNWSALHLACKDQNEIFLYLVQELGATLNVRNKNGLTLMHKAAIDNNNFLLTYLRDVGEFKIDEVDFENNTPLHYACRFGANFSTFWLLGFGQQPNAQNKQGDTPLHVLLKSGRVYDTKNVRELIFKGADRELKNNDG